MANNTENNTKSTLDRPLGLLIDGTELYSPSIFNESIYFGGISYVEITNSGKNYDVVTPSSLIVRNNSGIGSDAKIYGNMSGSLNEVIVVSPGIGYETKPNLTVVGGNFKGSVKLETNLVQKSINSAFLPNSTGVGNSTISFIEDHNFETGDEIIYNSNNSNSVSGLIETTSYFTRILNSKTISIYNRKDDALNGINFIDNLSPNVGLTTAVQYFYTKNTKNIIDKVYIEDSNAVFYNKIVKVPSNSYPNSRDLNGINLSGNYIYAKGHNFKEKDLIVYSSSGSVISGLSTTTHYFVTVLDENRFKLSDAGSSKISPIESNYNNQNFINFTTIGVGTHTFKYPKIEILTSVVSGISSTKPPVLSPVVLGSFDSIFIEDAGSGYGVKDIVNLQIFPDVIIEGSDVDNFNLKKEASFQPVIIDGKIVDVIILNSGDDYNDNIDIIVEGEGKYCKLYPVIENKKIKEVIIVSEGVGYNIKTTRIYTQRRGRDAKFLAKVNKWTINQYFKNKLEINSNSGESFVVPSRNVKNSLQSISFYPSKELREIVKDDETTRSNISDLSELPSTILGWSYDGNPIYGPYIKNQSGIGVTIVKSGYSLKGINNGLTNSLKRPNFQSGFFIEDYEYKPNTSLLDENNGMYIKENEEFPNGTYAYFVTLDSSFNHVYPYVIGPEFKNEPNLLNFNSTQNQNINISEKSYLKNTAPLYLTSSNSGYEYINPIQEKYKQELIVKNVLSSKIDGFKVIEPGSNYKVGDALEFTVPANDVVPYAVVDQIKGKTITSATVNTSTKQNIVFKVENNNIIGISTYPHLIKNDSYVTIKNSNKLELNNVEFVKVIDKSCTLRTNLGSSGIATYIEVDDIADFKVEDFISIDNEVAQILEIYPRSSKFYIHRLENLSSHTSGISTVRILPSRFEFKNKSVATELTVSNKRNFNPKYSVGIGTTGVSIENIESYTNYFIPENCIYIQNHKFRTNQKIKYSKNAAFNGLLVSNTPTSTPYRLQNNQDLYVINQGRNLIGITTVSYGTSSLTFRESSYSDNEIHSFNFVGTSFTGAVDVYSLNITTNVNHSLINGDLIKLEGKDDTFEYYVSQIDFSDNYQVNILNNTSFYLNLKKKPEFIEYPELNSIPVRNLDPNNLSYNTTSKNSKGGIKNVKLINSSSFYREIPIVSSVTSQDGSGAVILATSKTIGKIDTTDRIKDGFDYPSDITLQPKLSTNVIGYLSDNKKIKNINILNSGNKYNTPPNLIVLGRNDITLKSKIKNYSVVSVSISSNVNNLSAPLTILPTNNSNGFDILDIFNVSSDTNRILIDKTQFPLIYSDYSSPEVNFPFEIGDYIFIENCQVESSSGPNFNSSDNNYSYFEVIAVDKNQGRIDYRVSSSNFGTYTKDNGYGVVINKDDLAVFEMELETCDFIQGEEVQVLDIFDNVKFRAQILENNGWNKEKNEIRLTKATGTLSNDDIIKGVQSLIEARVVDTTSFTSKVKFGPSRDKNVSKSNLFDLNSDLMRLQDSNYYQDFSYSIISRIQYDDWKESVRSIVHPSGFKEFSDLQIISQSKNKKLNAKTKDTTLLFNVIIEGEKYVGTRDNYTIGYDENKVSNKVERVYFGSGEELWPVAGYGLTNVSGINLLPYFLNKTNKVIPLKLDGEFDGAYDLISLGSYSVTFNSNSPYYLGISTVGLNVGDIIGVSTYNQYPNNTRIISVGINSVRILYPHKVYSGSRTQTLEITRNLNQNQLVGITSFKLLTNNNISPFVVGVNSSSVNINQDTIVKIHNFQTGQFIKYENINGERIGIKTTSEVIGGISTNKLPSLVYLTKVSDNRFKLSGLSTSSPFNLTSTGSGTHRFTLANPNESALILIDNIIQSPMHRRDITLSLSASVGINTNVVYVSSGINSITSFDTLKIENEFLKVLSVGFIAQDGIEVERGFLGTEIKNHTGIQTALVYRGNYFIDGDSIHFVEPPTGPVGLDGIKVSSKFSGRAFSRTFSPDYPNDKNIILDDISSQFVGLNTFTLKENGNNVVGLYTNTNSTGLSNINNNPLILINNIPQVTNLNFTLENPQQNKINFISGTPKIGKILRFSINDDTFGYSPLVSAAATVSVSNLGEISQIYLNGGGSGYRIPPNIEIVSSVGGGASISAVVGASGSITSFTIVNSGVGYSSAQPPEIIVDSPIPYYSLGLSYDQSSSGIGTNAKVNVLVNQQSQIKNVELIEVGENYKVGDVLNVVGIVTDVNSGNSFSKLKITVDEVVSDTFTGLYPGQFIQFEDISPKFDSSEKIFDLYLVVDGDRVNITFKSNDLNPIENNLFVFLNDVLQEPYESYRYVDGRLVFTEPPVKDSTCNLLYYQGSLRDIELVKVRQTIKVGDGIKLEDSDLSASLISQDDRVVRRIVASNALDTFAYEGVGIHPKKVRPISWTKQKNDRIISGSLVSKSREIYKSKLYPSSKLIWNIEPDDTSFYVDNAYPLFTEYDGGIGELTKDNRSAIIAPQVNFNGGIFTVNVSSSSSISSVSVNNSGSGYDDDALISINSPQVEVKDPLYQWKYTSGISTTYSFNSIGIGSIVVGVGNSNLIAISSNAISWNFDTYTSPDQINLQKVSTSSANNFFAVGTQGTIIKKETSSSPWVLCGIKTEITVLSVVQAIVDSDYTGTFNDIIYNPNIDTWVSVGDGGKIYYGVGISTDTFIEARATQQYQYKSIDFNSQVMISVGYGGISRSTDATNWFTIKSGSDYNSVIWNPSDNSFVATLDGYIDVSNNNGDTWNRITLNPSINIKKIIKYNKVYIAVDDNNDAYTSLDLVNWLKRELPSAESINEIKNIKYNDNDYITLVGSAGTIYHSTPVTHKAVLEANITNGEVASIDILDGGFGYSVSNPPGILLELPKTKISVINSIDVVGDYGKIVGIKTSNTGIGTNSPKIDFELLSDYDTLNPFGVSYSGISVGDYFIIKNSNVGTVAGYALTGITTSLGGMSNYPNSKIGTATTFLDGVYRVDFVRTTNVSQGIVTVTCHFVPVNGGINLNMSGISSDYYGNYSWSKIFNYDQNSVSFEVNPDNGLIGLSSAPIVQRNPSLIF